MRYVYIAVLVVVLIGLYKGLVHLDRTQPVEDHLHVD